jgi:NAD(P)-dependent dehydrogenase (short-subunit alcohol dehydrogenase family)
MTGTVERNERRVAVVTGGSQGLGLALAEALAQRGWALVVDARRADRLEAVVVRLRALTDVTGVVGVGTHPDHRAALAAAAEQWGAVSIVVNNASTLGASPLPALGDVTLEVLRRTFEVNVIAPIALLQALDAALAPEATVVNITSDAAVESYPGWGGYGASKAALEQASRILAVERPDLRVLLVDPGDMRTEMHQDAFPGEDISDRPDPEESIPGIVALIDGDQPSGRYEARTLVHAESRSS